MASFSGSAFSALSFSTPSVGSLKGVAVAVLDSAGGAHIGGGQNFFFVDGQPVVVVGDPVQGHGPSVHAMATMITGSDWFTLNGKKVVRAGDQASCGHLSTGRSWFLSS